MKRKTCSTTKLNQFTPPNGNKLLTLIVCCMLSEFNLFSQSTITYPNPLLLEDGKIHSPSNSFLYPKLSADATTFDDGSVTHRVFAFVKDNAGTNGKDLLLSVDVDLSSTASFLIPYTLVNSGFGTTSVLFNPDIALVQHPTNGTTPTGVSAILVFDSDNALGAFVLEVDIDLMSGINFTNNTNLFQPVSNASSPLFSKQPKIDADRYDPANNQFAIVSIQDYSSPGVYETITAYGYRVSSTLYTIDVSFGVNGDMLASIPTSGWDQLNPDIAVTNDGSGNLQSIVCYEEEDGGTSDPWLMAYINDANGVNAPIAAYGDILYYSSSTPVTAVGDNNYPRICSRPDMPMSVLDWAMTASTFEAVVSPAFDHLLYVESLNPSLNYYLDYSSPVSNDSYNYLPALDWMTDEAFVAVGSDIVGPGYYETGVYGIMNPVYQTGGAPPYDKWTKINNYSMPTIKNAVAVASDPYMGGYVVAWFANDFIYYKVRSLDVTGFKPTDHDNSSDASVQIYPNPASDEIKIDLGDAMAKGKITDVFGRTIVNLNTNQKQYVIDVSQYANGTYYVKSASITSSFTVHH